MLTQRPRQTQLLRSDRAAVVAAPGGCGSSTTHRDSSPPEEAAEPAVEAEESACNIGMTMCWRPTPMTKVVAVEQRAVIEGSMCTATDPCRHVRIDAIGDDDIHSDERQSLVGVVCTLDADGLRAEGGGFYSGRLTCSYGKSYDFRYVKVTRIHTL